MDIIKQLSKEVRFYQNGRVIQTLQENVTANLNRTRNGIILEDVTGRSIEIFTSQIDETQKLPAPGVKFLAGTTEDLWDLLFDPNSAPFFNELHIKFASGGGGGGNCLGSFADENTGAPTFFPAGPYTSCDTYYNTSINQLMYYDSSRSRFLSIATITLNCGRTSTTSAGAFFRTAGNVTFILNSRGWYAPISGVLTAITATRTDIDDAQIEVMDGATIAAELDFSTNTAAADIYNVDFTTGNVVTVRVKPGSNAISNAVIILTFKLRSP